jgi:hypothetical protein
MQNEISLMLSPRGMKLFAKVNHILMSHGTSKLLVMRKQTNKQTWSFFCSFQSKYEKAAIRIAILDKLMKIFYSAR